nr:hypothetical protein [uncultured Caproiciproducens sp.]
MSAENMIACLDQKVILLTQIWDLTKQIEIRCTQVDIQLDNFLEQRGALIKRVNKCSNLIAHLTNDLPMEQKERMTQLLQMNVAEEGCNSEDELLILKLSKDCKTILQKAGVLDQSARNKIQEQCEVLRVKINQERKTEGNQNMYRNI